MNLSSIGYQNSSYTGNNNVTRRVEHPVNKDKKQTYKKVGLTLAGAAILALALTKGKSAGKLFGKLGGESKAVVDTSKKAGEKMEEIVPEVLDFDTVWGPKIAARKKAKMQPPKTIVIDEKGNILGERREMGSMSDFIDNMRKHSERSKGERIMDAVIDFIDNLGWMI